MKNEVVLVSLIFIVVLSSIALADTTNATSIPSLTADESSVAKAYQCINNQLSNKTSFSLQEAVFGELALGYQQKLQDEIDSEKKTDTACWPKAGCTLKDTAQVLLLYNKLGKDTSDIKSWLLSKNISMTDLDWYLEADISKHNQSACTIKYDSTTRNLLINNDMSLSAPDGDLGGCLTISGYWMKISPSCYSKTFQTSCTEDFVSTLLYTKTNDASTVYVSSSTHSAPSSGTTSESINAKCFRTGSVCDYEGSLWASLALQKAGVDVSQFTPYLIALAQDNTQLFPYSFIYMISGGSDQFDKVVQAQKQNQYWEAPSTRYNKFYDSALAMLAISGSADNALDNTKNYFLAIQSGEGCWNNNNFKDTSFLLYSGWPKEGSTAPGTGSTNYPVSVCESIGSTRSCEFSYACAQAGGSVLSEFSCDGAKSCCSIKVQDQSCSSKSGKICLADEQCSGSSVPSSEGSSCCLGSCDKIVIQETCTVQSGGTCKSSCSSSEDKVSGTCAVSQNVCCKAKTTSSVSWWIVLLLLILIILISLAIMYKDKLTIYWYKFKANQEQQQKKQAQQPQRFNPSIPPRPAQRQMSMQRQPQRTASAQRPSQRPAQKKPLSQSEKELEETLKKLRDMSK